VVTAAGSTSLTVIVPTGATFHPVSVTAYTKTAASSKPFIVTYPGAAAFSGTAYSTKIDMNMGFKPEAKLADIDGDGKLDMIVADKVHGKINIYKNISSNDSVLFAPETELYAGSNPVLQEIKDYDGDGKADIFYRRDSTSLLSTLSLLKNNSSPGNISFTYWYNPGSLFTDQTYDMQMADLNGDGKPDIQATLPYLTSLGSEHIKISESYSTSLLPAFEPISLYSIVSNGVSYPNMSGRASSIVPADFDNDGKQDLLVGLSSDWYYTQPYFTIVQNTTVPGNPFLILMQGYRKQVI
jgi:hypothetical protein